MTRLDGALLVAFYRVQFRKWFEEAHSRGLIPREGMAMTLATCTTDGFPSARVRNCVVGQCVCVRMCVCVCMSVYGCG